MTCQPLRRTASALAYRSIFSVVFAISLASSVFAQALGEKFREDQRELAELFDAAQIAQARVFEEIAAIDRSAHLRAARNDFETSLRRRATMSMAEMMAMMRMHSRMGVPGPYYRRPGGWLAMPVELPMTPAIAPRLFTLSPETAIVLDNLNVFETVVADILSYPNLANKPALLNSLVDDFTDRGANFETTIDYLVSALRGGIYNQGGPAVGELQQSERNRSRMEMGMQHSMIMSTQ